MHTAYLVAGLGHGDEGKGSLTDFLCRSTGTKLVVRYNGGPQASHAVVDHAVVEPGGRYHRFSQFGSGTFAGAYTYLSQYMMVEPFALMNEARALEHVCGIEKPLDRLTIDPECLVITPYHWIANRIRERARGNARHGSCGFGVGEARHDAEDDLAIRVKDMDNCEDLLRSIQRKKMSELALYRIDDDTADLYHRLRESPKEIAQFYRFFIDGVRIYRTALDSHLAHKGPIVFEGAQGVLLDEKYGPAPYHTWTDTTYGNARKLLFVAPHATVVRVGVIRSYATRHGAGPLVTEGGVDWPEEHNGDHPWQGKFRQGAFDAVATRYAIRCLGGIDQLAVTHMDRVVGPAFRYCSHYRSPDGAIVQDVDFAAVGGDELFRYTPWMNTRPSIWRACEAELGHSIEYAAYGPTESDWRAGTVRAEAI